VSHSSSHQSTKPSFFTPAIATSKSFDQEALKLAGRLPSHTRTVWGEGLLLLMRCHCWQFDVDVVVDDVMSCCVVTELTQWRGTCTN